MHDPELILGPTSPNEPNENDHQWRILCYVVNATENTKGSIQVRPPLGPQARELIKQEYNAPGGGTIKISYVGKMSSVAFTLEQIRGKEPIDPGQLFSDFNYDYMPDAPDGSVPSPDALNGLVATVLRQANVISDVDQLGSK